MLPTGTDPAPDTLPVPPSCPQSQCLPYEDFMLPAGYDPVTGSVVEQAIGAPSPLSCLHVLLAAASDSEWGQLMAQVLASAGARVKLDNQVSGHSGSGGTGQQRGSAGGDQMDHRTVGDFAILALHRLKGELRFSSGTTLALVPS